MAVVDPKERAIATANKLLRLASPKSGTTVDERASALEKALAIIFEHDLVVALPPAKVRRPRPSPVEWKSKVAEWISRNIQLPPENFGGNWTSAYAAEDCVCTLCNRTIYEGEPIWFDVERGVMHEDLV